MDEDNLVIAGVIVISWMFNVNQIPDFTIKKYLIYRTLYEYVDWNAIVV